MVYKSGELDPPLLLYACARREEGLARQTNGILIGDIRLQDDAMHTYLLP